MGMKKKERRSREKAKKKEKKKKKKGSRWNSVEERMKNKKTKMLLVVEWV